VDLLLQPSWTWGAILTRHMEGNAVRAVENGFSLLRCSSQGESGVVGGWVLYVLIGTVCYRERSGGCMYGSDVCMALPVGG